jgi:hypothetical protein
MTSSVTEKGNALSPESQTVQSASAEKTQTAVNVLPSVHGILFSTVAAALPMLSLDLIGVVVRYNIDEFIVKVGGDLEQLPQGEQTTIDTAAKDVSFWI